MSEQRCFSCGKSEKAFPLVTLRFDGMEGYVCPQCLPALIHHPEKIAEKIGTIGKRPA